MKKEISRQSVPKSETADQRAVADFIRDRGELANAPYPGKIPAWWLLEGAPEEVEELLRQLAAGEAEVE